MCAENSEHIDADDLDFQRVVLLLLEHLYKGGYRYFYTGLFEGFDLTAADLVLAMKLKDGYKDAKLIYCIATLDQASDYQPFNRNLFADILGKADDGLIIGQRFVGSKLTIEDEFIEHSNLIVYWNDLDDPDPDLEFSLDKAREKGLQLINIREIHEEEL